MSSTLAFRGAACIACWLGTVAAHAQATPSAPTVVPTGSNALFVEVAGGFVPYANDVPIMVGAGARLAGIHEVWARFGYMTTGDDVELGFGVVGYRLVLRPRKFVRPLFGGLVAGLPATCTHDALGQQACSRVPLFISAATAGVRVEPKPWLGLFTVLSLGTDTYPNPFGMVELGVSLSWPST
jgi:hypothetical protein